MWPNTGGTWLMEGRFNTSYMAEVYRHARDRGGLFNAHLHIDRAETLQATWEMMRDQGTGEESSLAIAQKHALIPMIHNSHCYEPDSLEERVQACVTKMAELGTRHAHSVVDVTPDRVGTTAMDRLLRIADRSRAKIDFRVGAYSPLGFAQDDSAGWELIKSAATSADFLGSLPERDDRRDYPDHIGFDASCRRILSIAFGLGKDVHIHVDQKNLDHEDQSERVIRIVRDEGFIHDGEAPRIWLIHVISPSAYDEARFSAMVQALAELNIGVICCPSAAISMRQLRPLVSPTHNSIARVLEMLAAGIHVGLGTDHVCDVTSPAGTLDVMDEIFVLSNALRYYDTEVMACLAAGCRLTHAAEKRIADHLEEDRRQCALAQHNYSN
jgi:cytosine/adenosine deaminase-related metal-dependent hydrolase